MTCATARTLMLTADPTELAGSTGSDLSLHVATCIICRAQATLLIEAQAELTRALDAAMGDVAPDAVRGVLAAARRRRDGGRRWRWTIPVAAAAVVVGVLLIRIDRPPTERVRRVPAPVAARGVTVAAPPGRNVAVLQTDNPNLVVIWFF